MIGLDVDGVIKLEVFFVAAPSGPFRAAEGA